jgi:hypothetical protein
MASGRLGVFMFLVLVLLLLLLSLFRPISQLGVTIVNF